MSADDWPTVRAVRDCLAVVVHGGVHPHHVVLHSIIIIEILVITGRGSWWRDAAGCG